MNKNGSLDCFKSYDIRGILGCELNEKLAFKIGYAVAKKLKAQTLLLIVMPEKAPLLLKQL